MPHAHDHAGGFAEFVTGYRLNFGCFSTGFLEVVFFCIGDPPRPGSFVILRIKPLSKKVESCMLKSKLDCIYIRAGRSQLGPLYLESRQPSGFV